LIFKDFGKTAFTLTKRDGKGVRISSKAEGKAYMHSAHPIFAEHYKKVIGERNRSDDEIAGFKKMGVEKAFATLTLDFDRLFKTEEVVVEIPDYAPSHESIVCTKCGEPIMATRIIMIDEAPFCLPCARIPGNKLDGQGITLSKK